MRTAISRLPPPLSRVVCDHHAGAATTGSWSVQRGDAEGPSPLRWLPDGCTVALLQRRQASRSMKRGSRRILQSLERFAACGGRFACSVRASLTMASGVGRRPASQVRSVSRATPRAVAHSAWDRPSRVRTSLRAEACLAIGHDDAISPPLVGSEGIAMKTRGSRPLRNGSTTAGSISVGRFRPGRRDVRNVARFRGCESVLSQNLARLARRP